MLEKAFEDEGGGDLVEDGLALLAAEEAYANRAYPGTDIPITLPTPRADANYGVVAVCQGVTNISAFDITNKTTTGFHLVAIGSLTAADVILFTVGEITP